MERAIHTWRKMLAILPAIAAVLKDRLLHIKVEIIHVLGRLAETEGWFIIIPAVVLLTYGQITAAWEEKAPYFDSTMQILIQTKWNNCIVCINKLLNKFALAKGGKDYEDRIVK